MAQLTDNEINEYLKPYSQGGRPFLKHLDYFKENGEITACSIGDRWSHLSGENGLKTYIKGQITVRGANKNNDDYKNGTCPWKHSFDSDYMMKCLKHPCDTGIVNQDGSINFAILKKVIKSNFELDAKTNLHIMKRSTMYEYLKQCKKRDEHLELKPGWELPSFDTIAHFEWYDFYYNFCDIIVDDEESVTIKTFLQLYFEPDVLYNRKLSGELPVKKNK